MHGSRYIFRHVASALAWRGTCGTVAAFPPPEFTLNEAVILAGNRSKLRSRLVLTEYFDAAEQRMRVVMGQSKLRDLWPEPPHPRQSRSWTSRYVPGLGVGPISGWDMLADAKRHLLVANLATGVRLSGALAGVYRRHAHVLTAIGPVSANSRSTFGATQSEVDLPTLACTAIDRRGGLLIVVHEECLLGRMMDS